MKQFSILLFVFSLSFSFGWAQSGSAAFQKSVRKHQKKQHKHFKSKKDSPLTTEDREHFEGLEYYATDEKYRVTAKFTLTPDEKPFDMLTSSGKLKKFVKYGTAEFTLDGKPYTLALYQNLKFIDHPKYGKFLFLPFKDHTCGNGTYGGGRFMDIKIPKEETVVIDFNEAYNPYCAYSTGWNCPIPPDENHLEVEILAGVKDWKEH